MSVEKLQSVERSTWDWNGNFAEAAGHGAQFSLYLAMQFGASLGTPSFNPAADNQTAGTHHLQAFSFYRRPNLKADQADFMHSRVVSAFITHGDVSSARLFESMHPAPLSCHNDASHIPDNVIANCALATQRRLQGHAPGNFDEDNTLLDDVIDKASKYMVA